MEAILGFFVFGAIGWYIATLAFIVWMFIIVENDKYGQGIFDLILFLLFLQFVGKITLTTYISANPLMWVGFIAAYLVIGLSWSFLKWWLYVNDKADNARKIKEDFLEEHTPQLPKELKIVTFDNHISSKTGCNLKAEWDNCRYYGMHIPSAMDNKGRISIWLTHWPISMIWSLLNDFIKRIAERIITSLKGVYQGMSNKAFKDI